MNVLDVLFISTLIITYGRFVYNILNGVYKHNIKNMLIDIVVSYYLAPLLAVVIVWGMVDGIKLKNK